jgi:hypothetical protein
MASLTMPGALAPLRHRRFRLLTIGQVSSNVGDACYAVALPWYVLATHGGAILRARPTDQRCQRVPLAATSEQNSSPEAASQRMVVSSRWRRPMTSPIGV